MSFHIPETMFYLPGSISEDHLFRLSTLGSRAEITCLTPINASLAQSHTIFFILPTSNLPTLPAIMAYQALLHWTISITPALSLLQSHNFFIFLLHPCLLLHPKPQELVHVVHRSMNMWGRDPITPPSLSPAQIYYFFKKKFPSVTLPSNSKASPQTFHKIQIFLPCCWGSASMGKSKGKSKSSNPSKTSTSTPNSPRGTKRLWFSTMVGNLHLISDEEIWALGSIPFTSSLIIHGLMDRSDQPPEGHYTFSRDQLQSGLRFSIPHFYRGSLFALGPDKSTSS